MATDKRRRGAVMVFVAITLMVLLGFLGLSVDWGKIAFNIHQMQNAGDAAALAGAQIVKVDELEARARTVALALANKAENLDVVVDENATNAPDGEVVLGRWLRQSREFVPTLLSPNAVRVRVKRPSQAAGTPPLAMIFGRAFGVPTANAGRIATAMSQGSTGAGIICLADNPAPLPGWSNFGTGLLLDGGAEIDLRGFDPVTGEPMVGDIQVNAQAEVSPWSAMRAGGTIWAGDIDVVGATNPVPTDDKKWEDIYADPTDPPSVNTGSPTMPDPLADIVPPDIATMAPGSDTTGKQYYDPATGTFETISGGTLTLNPGWYPGGIDMSNGDITLNPGVYAFGGGTDETPGFAIGGGTVTGNGVMIYVTGDQANGVEYGRINIGANSVVNLVSRGDAMTPKQVDGEMGVVLWQDRENDNYVKIIGGGDSDMTGTIYCPSCAVEVGGSFDQMGSQLIAGALWVHGKIALGIAYDGRNFVESLRAVLVE